MLSNIPHKLILSLLAALLLLGCASTEPQVFPITVDMKMDAQEQYLLESGHLPGD